jgi:hypothetical protein
MLLPFPFFLKSLLSKRFCRQNSVVQHIFPSPILATCPDHRHQNFTAMAVLGQLYKLLSFSQFNILNFFTSSFVSLYIFWTLCFQTLSLKVIDQSVCCWYISQCSWRLIRQVRRSCDADKLKLKSDGGDSGSKKCKRGYGGAYGGVFRSLFGGSLESGCRFGVGTLSRKLA